MILYCDAETWETTTHVACLNGAPLDLIAGMLKAAGDKSHDLGTMMDKCRLKPLAAAA